MTVYRLERGTLVTYNGVVAKVENRATDPVGYWARSVRDPLYAFVVTDEEVALGFEGKGPFRVGGENGSCSNTAATEAQLPDPLRLSKRDHLVLAYRRRIADAVKQAVKDPSRGMSLMAATEAALAEVAAPRGVAQIRVRAAADHLRNWKASGRKPLALAPRNAWKGNRTTRKPGFIQDAVEEAVDARYRGWGSQPIIRQHAIMLARRTWEEVYRRARTVDGVELPADADGDVDWMKLVSPAYVRDRVNKRSAKYRAARSYGAEHAKKAFDTALAGPQVTRPLAVVEGDDMFLTSVFVVDDEDWFPLGFPVVSLFLDQATQAVVGRYVGFGGPTSDSVGKGYEHAAYPKDVSGHLDEDGKPIFSKTWTMGGKIQVLKSDMGSPYLSGHIEDASYRAGTVLHPLPPASPKLKGRVERFIRTFKEGSAGAALRILPRRLRRPLKKGSGPLLVTLLELLLIIDYWIVEEYHEEVHHSHGMTPREAWEKWTQEMPVDPPPSREEIQMIMGKYVPTRTLNKNGLRMLGLEYNSDAAGTLREYYGDLDGIIRDVEAKYQSEDISTAWALFPDPERPGSTLAVPAYCKHMHYARGLSEYRHSVIVEHAKETAKEGVITVHQLMEAKQRLARMAEDMYAQRVANGGTARIDAVLKAHRTYLKEPAELPEDAPLALLDHESFGDDNPAASAVKRPPAVQGAMTQAPRRPGGCVRRKLGRLDNV